VRKYRLVDVRATQCILVVWCSVSGVVGVVVAAVAVGGYESEL
jgi:hypothetical protein